MIEHDNLEEFQDPANYDLEETQNSIANGRYYADLAERVQRWLSELESHELQTRTPKCEPHNSRCSQSYPIT